MLSQDQQELLLQQKNINRLQRRENRYKYLGILGEYQIVASKNLYQKLDYTKLKMPKQIPLEIFQNYETGGIPKLTAINHLISIVDSSK